MTMDIYNCVKNEDAKKALADLKKIYLSQV
jgi:hypothetical protein